MKIIMKLLLLIGLVTLLGCSKDSGGSSQKEEPTEKKVAVDNDPIANAGGDRNGITTKDMSNVQTQELLFLDGSASYGSTFTWSVVSKPTTAAQLNFISSTTKSTGVYGDTSGKYEVMLRVVNKDGKEATDKVTITLLDDADADGLSDSDDADRDGDGFLNINDLFPDNIVSHIDFDGDGKGNYFSADTDGDGVDDVNDDFPLDSSKTALSVYKESKENNTTYNKNDGITIAETTNLSVPLQIEGRIYSEDGYSGTKTDSDFYSVALVTGNYSIVIDALDPSMNLIVSMVDAQGAAVSSITTDISALKKSLTSVYVPSDATYYLIVTDAQGKSDASWNYTIKIFSDSDMDGLSDTLEQAIESNENTPDSDGDGIIDFIEYTYAYESGLADVDGDKIPNWWDYDSDNDGLSDSIEFYTQSEKPDMSAEELNILNDIDEDGKPNFLDLDSDGNGVLDSDEIGENYINPLDTDGDTVPDYLDLDNDNDGILDISEKKDAMNRSIAMPGENLPYAESLLIKSLENKTLGIEKVCSKGDSMEVILENVPAGTSSVMLTFKGLQDSINQDANITQDGVVNFICPDNIDKGEVEFFVTLDDSMRTIGEDLLFVDEKTPLITSASYNAYYDRLEIEGQNLNSDLTIILNGNSYSYDNSYGYASSFTYTKGYGDTWQSGMLAVEDSDGISNQLYVAIKRDVSVTVQSPNTSVAMSSIDFSVADDSYAPDYSGYLTLPVKVDTPMLAAATIEDTTTSVEDPDYIPYLYAVVLPEDTSVNVDAKSTALALVYSGLGLDAMIEESQLSSAISAIEALPEVQTFAQTVQSELSVNKKALINQSKTFVEKSNAALLAAATYLDAEITKGTYTKKSSNKSSAPRRGIYGADATVTPSSADGIEVYERGDTGNINIYNDTQLYLSARITDMKGKILQDHPTSYFSSNLVNPQGYGLLFWAYTSELNLPGGQNCNVEIVTPGLDSEYDPKISSDNSDAKTKNIHKYLAIRTLVERVTWPVLSEILGEYMDAHTFINILYTYATPTLDIIVNDLSQEDGYTKAAKSLFSALSQDLFSQPPGPITTAIAKTALGTKVKNVAKEFAKKLVKKIAKKIGMKAVPVIGQISAAYEVAGHLNNGLNVAGAVYDLSTKDAIIDFSVVFPVSITSVSPNKIIPDGSSRKFTIHGTGFSEIKEHFYNFSGVKPEITFTDGDGLTTTLTPSYIKPDGTAMTVEVPGDFLYKYIQGPIDVSIHHPTFNKNSIVTKKAAIEVVDKVTLSSITPDSGATGVEAVLSGSGFSLKNSENEVTVGGKTALIAGTSADSIKIIIPSSLKEGEQDVKVRTKVDGKWTEWSNSVTYTVKLSSITVTVCDDGGAKDDAFQLYVNNSFVGSMYATDADYCDTYHPKVNIGTNTAMLQGIEAPDGVGTYSIEFSGVTNVSGASLSGTDLTPGVTKNYTFEVSDTQSASAPRRSLKAYPYIIYRVAE